MNSDQLRQFKAIAECGTLTKAAEDHFRVPDDIYDVLIYRIGGVGMPLLMSGSYKLTDFRLKVQLVHNWETPKVVGQAIAEFIIADERYMNTAISMPMRASTSPIPI